MVLIVCASVGANLKLSEELNEIAKELELPAKVVNLVDYRLPLYSTVEEKENGVPQGAQELANEFLGATGFVFVAPEYNGGVPPVLNNAFAWVSRSGSENWREAFQQKFAICATHSGGPGNKALIAMETILGHLGCNVLARKVSTTYGKDLKKETGVAVLSELKKLV